MQFIFENKRLVIHVENNMNKANRLPAGWDRDRERKESGKAIILTLIQKASDLNMSF